MAWDDGLTRFETRTVAPTAFPVSLDYIKTQVLRVATDTTEDTHIMALIEAAVDAAEGATQRAIMPQTHVLYLSGFPCGREIHLPRPPLIEIDSIYYYNEDNTLTLWSSSPAPYILLPSGVTTRAQIVRPVDTAWPTTYERPDAVQITYQCGYASSAAVPARIIQGICLHVQEQYRQRSLGVINVQYSPAALQLEHFWKRVPDA